MKKFFKRKSTEDAPQTETNRPDAADMPDIINKMQAQLVSLENKLDTLISRSSERNSEEKRFSKPFQRFDRPSRYGAGRRDSRPEERSFTQAVCADCKQECEVLLNLVVGARYIAGIVFQSVMRVKEEILPKNVILIGKKAARNADLVKGHKQVFEREGNAFNYFRLE